MVECLEQGYCTCKTGNCIPHESRKLKQRIEELKNQQAEYENEASEIIYERYKKIEELEAAQKWQPIETAPKDGTLFLGYYQSHGNDKDGFIKETWWGPVKGKQMWMLRGHMIDPINNLTHWIPRPKPPQAIKGEGDG